MVKTEWALCPIVSKNTKMVVEYGKQRRNNEGGDLRLCPHCFQIYEFDRKASAFL